jgi:hypothetical protein
VPWYLVCLAVTVVLTTATMYGAMVLNLLCSENCSHDSYLTGCHGIWFAVTKVHGNLPYRVIWYMVYLAVTVVLMATTLADWFRAEYTSESLPAKALIAPKQPIKNIVKDNFSRFFVSLSTISHVLNRNAENRWECQKRGNHFQT